MAENVVYGPGGFDPTKPDNNVVTVVVVPDTPPPAPSVDTAVAVAARLVATERIIAVAVDDATVADLAPLFAPWVPGEVVVVGALRSWDGTVVECIQAHTTQADWTPDVTPALWKVHRTALDPWVQPTGGHDAYNIGDRVRFEGAVYESVIDANVWSPTGYPAGWQLVT